MGGLADRWTGGEEPSQSRAAELDGDKTPGRRLEVDDGFDVIDVVASYRDEGVVVLRTPLRRSCAHS
jgi:hypothetical protein